MGFTLNTNAAGDGRTFPRKGDTVHIHYTGSLPDGTQFDSSFKRGKPLIVEIGIGKMIKGWDEGVLKMSLGEKATLIADPDHAYGASGFPPFIPPEATLRFDMELIRIE